MQDHAGLTQQSAEHSLCCTVLLFLQLCNMFLVKGTALTSHCLAGNNWMQLIFAGKQREDRDDSANMQQAKGK